MNFKRLTATLLCLALLSLAVFPAFAQSDDDQAFVIEAAETSEIFADWLAQHEGYIVNAYGPDEDNLWYVEFFNADESDWLGYASINGETGEIIDSFAPVPLAADEYQEWLPRVTTFVLNDPEVLARLNNTPDLWDMYADYNRWEQQWQVGFYRGLEAIQVNLWIDDASEEIYVDAIVDPNLLSEEEAIDNARDTAINIAYGLDSLWQTLDGVDNWTSYAEHQGGDTWSVSFLVEGEARFFALVDVETGAVLSSEVLD